MPKSPESHYNIDKLHAIFAIVSFILLGTLGMFIMKDYNREWKDYQREFHAIEVEKTRVKHDAARVALDANEEYQTLKEDLKKVKEAHLSKCTLNESEQKSKADLNAKFEIANQDFKFKKAQLDAAHFRLEEAFAHSHK